MKRSAIFIVLVLVIVSAIVLFLFLKPKKKVTFAAPPQPVIKVPDVKVIPQPAVEEPEEPEEDIVNDNGERIHITPNYYPGINTRDGRIKNIDIRGTPAVKISDVKPMWNISPNNLPVESKNNFF